MSEKIDNNHIINTPTVQQGRNSSRWHNLRQGIQVLILLAFLALTLVTLQGSGPLSHLFFDLDPLTGISAMLAGKDLIPSMLGLGLVTLILALFLGRAWCGWICPMGTVLDWVPSRKTRKDEKDLPAYWRQVKYFLFIAIVVAALFGSLTLIFLDPITLVFRTLSGAVIPGLGEGIEFIESGLYNFASFQSVVSWLDGALRPLLITSLPFYLPNLILLAFFAAILALNAVRQRFWCRYLCPLGGLLGLVAKVQLFGLKVNEGSCKSCGKCAAVCPTGAIRTGEQYRVKNDECTLCLNCVDNCRFGSYKFARLSPAALQPQTQPVDPARRQFLYSIGAGVIGAMLIRFVPVMLSTVKGFLRPPGATESSIQNKCIRCGECVKVCPTGVIQPDSSGSSWDKLWTPEVKMRHAYCDYACNSCGQVCPTGAIPPLALETKQLTTIGKARIDQKRCIPYSQGLNCGVCEEVCPLPNKAIRFEEQGVEGSVVNLPVVNQSHCIGCGICEYKCPVAGESAIQVIPIGNTSLTSDGGGKGRGGNR